MAHKISLIKKHGIFLCEISERNSEISLGNRNDGVTTRPTAPRLGWLIVPPNRWPIGWSLLNSGILICPKLVLSMEVLWQRAGFPHAHLADTDVIALLGGNAISALLLF
jgi:hypothetical protein